MTVCCSGRRLSTRVGQKNLVEQSARSAAGRGLAAGGAPSISEVAGAEGYWRRRRSGKNLIRVEAASGLRREGLGKGVQGVVSASSKAN